MPAWNAAGYIEEAIASVLAQTEEDWELVIADDGSTDGTGGIARDYAARDPRIRYVAMPAPSGGAYAPRRLAIEEARSALVAPLDADDFVDPGYLAGLLADMERTGAEAVYPELYEADGDSRRLRAPLDAALRGTSMAGCAAVRLTLDGWRLSCAGGLIRRDLYMRCFAKYGDGGGYIYADELLSRQLLLEAGCVALSTERYYYRVNPGSVCHRRSLRLFDALKANRDLAALMDSRCGAASEEALLAVRQQAHGVLDALRIARRCRGALDAAQMRQARDMILAARAGLDRRRVRRCVSAHYRLLLRLPLPLASALLHGGDALRRAWRSLRSRAARFLQSNRVC